VAVAPRSRMRIPEVVSDAWTPDAAERMAHELGIALRPAHWHVIGCARELRASLGSIPDFSLLARVTGLSIDAICSLFPGAERTVAWIAGLGASTSILLE